MEKICPVCQTRFEGRSDAKFCGASCRSKSHKEQQQQQANMPQGKMSHDPPSAAPFEPRLETSENLYELAELKELYHDLDHDQHEYIQWIRPESAKLREHRRRFDAKEKALEKQKQQLQRLREQVLELQQEKREIDSRLAESKNADANRIIFGKGSAQQDVERLEIIMRHIYTGHDMIAKEEQELAERQQRVNGFRTLLMKDESELEEAKETLKEVQEELKEVIACIEEHKKPVYQPKPPIQPIPIQQYATKLEAPVKKLKIKPALDEIGAGDLLGMNFPSFQLPGVLGQFLGRLDRNKTCFALTGDSGAGKTYFAFQMAKLFIHDLGIPVKMFSLEEGIGRITQEKVREYELGNNMMIAAKGTIHDVRKAAEEFPLVIVDSFTKLNTKTEEFEKLRTDFPKTIFLLIFQKTTSGTMRGGSAIKYDSSATINVAVKDGHRIAIMEKGRYGTSGWEYDITDDRIIKRNLA